MACSFLDEEHFTVSALLLRDVGLYVMGRGTSGRTRIIAQSTQTHIEVEKKPSYSRHFLQVSIDGKKHLVMEAVLQLMEMIYAYQDQNEYPRCPLRIIFHSATHELSKHICLYEELEKNTSTRIMVEEGWKWSPPGIEPSEYSERHSIVIISGDLNDIDNAFHYIVNRYQRIQEILEYEKKVDVTLCVQLEDSSFEISKGEIIQKTSNTMDANVNTDEIDLLVNPEIKRLTVDASASSSTVIPPSKDTEEVIIEEVVIINPDTPTSTNSTAASSSTVIPPSKDTKEVIIEEVVIINPDTPTSTNSTAASSSTLIPPNETIDDTINDEVDMINPEALVESEEQGSKSQPTDTSVAMKPTVAALGTELIRSEVDETTGNPNNDSETGNSQEDDIVDVMLNGNPLCSVSSSNSQRSKTRRILLKIAMDKMNRVFPKKPNAAKKKEHLHKPAGDAATSTLRIKSSLNGKESEVFKDDDSSVSEKTPSND